MFISNCVSSSVKKVQNKLFGRQQTTPTTPLQSDDTSLQDRVDPPTPLTINIPKPQATPTLPVRKNTTDSSPRQDADNTFNQDTEAMPQMRSYRERLAQQLGDKYKGAEKYRLREDDKREKHWKRWGPYLSDRQWVKFWRSHLLVNSFSSYLTFRLLFERTTRPETLFMIISSLLIVPLYLILNLKHSSRLAFIPGRHLYSVLKN